MEEQQAVAGPQAAELHTDCLRYLDARGLWIDAWYRTAPFVSPAVSKRPIERLLVGDSGRVLLLWGPGGMGKSTHLRWLIARRCVPRPDRIAAALVDFDFVDPRAATLRPWLVLLEVAAQLNRQLPGAPFHELLAEYGDQRGQLRATTLRTEVPSEPTAGPHEAAIAGNVRRRVGGVLAELPHRERVLVAVDTLEVPLLVADREREEVTVTPLLRELAMVHDKAPSLRLVLCCRYDLSSRLFEYSRLFPAGRALQLSGLTASERRRYLTHKRHVADPELLAAALKVAGPVPFKLALVADVIDQSPEVTAAELATFESADLVYLVERIVAQTEPRVRWLLRYGVVPRTLDFAFVRDVLGPYLVAAMSGQARGDAPDRDRITRSAPLWRTDILQRGEALDLRSAWLELKRYAGQASWVEAVTADDAVRFHPDVVGPMRRLLATHAVFAEIQRDAAVYFERRSQADPERWADWTREAVFHRFQMNGRTGARYWRQQLEKARGQPAARRELAQEVLGPDYLDREGREEDRLGPEILIEGHFELALASAELAATTPVPAGDPLWEEATRALETVVRLQHGRRRLVVPASRISLVRAAIGLAAGDAGSQRDVEAALRGRISEAERLWLLPDEGSHRGAG